MGLILLDSVIVMDVLNGIDIARAYLKSLDDAAFSVITQIEVLAGTHGDAQERLARNLLGKYPRLELTQDIAERAGKIRREIKRLKLPDAVVLATAEVHGVLLATRNTKDFSPDWPRVVVPYTLN